MKKNTKLIFDFDGTFTKVEALDELAKIVLKNEPDKKKRDKIVSKIKEITSQGMNGEITFRESLDKRIALLDIIKEDIQELVDFLKSNISDSVLRNKEFFIENSKNIIIVSGGFKEFIVPIVKDFGIKEENVYANNFVFDDEGKVLDFNKDNPLSMAKGKIKLVKSLKFDLKKIGLIMIGDGYTDFEVKKEGACSKFLAYTENFYRKNVVDEADGELKSLEDLFGYV